MTNTDPISSIVRLRTATPGDAALLAALGARLFEQTFGADNTAEDMAAYLAEAFALNRQHAELSDPQRITWIAEHEDGTPIGYAVLIRDEKTASVEANRPAELRRIYLDQQVQGRPVGANARGVGALFVDLCVSQARAWQCDVIWLAVWERNPRAIRFYEKHGFQQVGRKTFQLGSDTQHDLVMARNL